MISSRWEKRITRNPFCTLYEDCLDLAAKANLPDWDCSKCPMRNSRAAIRVDRHEIEACFKLIWALFGEKASIVDRYARRGMPLNGEGSVEYHEED